MFASTDGLYTSFGSEYDFLDYHTIIASQLTDPEALRQIIINNLTKRSRFGTEDDISLACVFDSELLNDSIDLINQRVEENRQQASDRKAELLKKRV